MKVIYNYNGECHGPKAVGLGNFDGLHLGHMTLINTLTNKAKAEGIKSIVYTFRQHPENVLAKNHSLPLLTSLDKKIELLSKTGLDFLYFDEFDEQYSLNTPENFIKDILVKKLEARIVVVGFNYRYGHKGRGDLELLEKLGTECGFRLIVIPPVRIDNKVVSSSFIRDLLIAGKTQTAAKCLGRYYSLTGTVQSGDRRGAVLGFPTANILPGNHLVIPARGVYLTKTKIDGQLLDSVTNVGIKPTFTDTGQASIETHIIDYCNDIYEKTIEVFFIKKIRDEIKFASAEQLKERVMEDISLARRLHSCQGCQGLSMSRGRFF
jgi:riboflavin kinase/FMN adenylyltransferase